MNLPVTNEQEAAAAILFACVMQPHNKISEQEIEQLSRAIVLSAKFRNCNVNELTIAAISLQAKHSVDEVIESCTPAISNDFKETLFAMVSELLLLDGAVNDEKTKVLAKLALHLQMSMERMKMILATYLIRNKWNITVG